MIFQDLVRDAFKNLAANALRSGLTMLGVIIGVASVITMIAIVEGGQQWLVRSIERLGTNLLFAWNKTLTAEEQRQYEGRSTGLTHADARAIRARFSDVLVVPVITLDKQLKSASRDASGDLTATVPAYRHVRNFYTDRGRFLIEEDIAEWRRVVVLGKEVADDLFKTESPLYREVKIGGHRFLVVGVMAPKGIVYGTNYDKKVFIPVTTAIRRFTGEEKLNRLLIHVPQRDRMDEIRRQIHAFLIQRHDGVDDVNIRSQGDFLTAVEQTIWTFRIVLGGVATVALLVGGIGIMNIMLVTVTERTREIGLRKAIGANRRDILLQFLVESLAISLAGGLIGAILGIAVAYGFGDLVAKAMPGGGDWGALVQPSAILIAVGFAVAVGVFFGLYPAVKASKLDPAEALRHQ